MSFHFNSFHCVSFNSVSFQFSSVQFSSVQFSSVQFSSVQFKSVQFSTVQFISINLNFKYLRGVALQQISFSKAFHNKACKIRKHLKLKCLDPNEKSKLPKLGQL